MNKFGTPLVGNLPTNGEICLIGRSLIHIRDWYGGNKSSGYQRSLAILD